MYNLLKDGCKMTYDLNIVEEELKNKISEDYFKNFDSTQIIEQINTIYFILYLYITINFI